MDKTKDRKWILWGIPVLFVAGSLLHFLYDWTGSLFPVGLFVPVNESVFEHMKLIPLPLILWWTLYLGKAADKNAWGTAAVISLFVSLLTVPLLFYFYTGAFGIENMWIDIAILLVALCFGQLLGLHYYKHGRGFDYRLGLFILFAVLILFALLTVFPPRLPIFQDPQTGLFGIFKNQF